MLGKNTGKQTHGRDAKLFVRILIYATTLPKSLARREQAVQIAVSPRCDVEVHSRAPTTALQVLQVAV